MRGPTFIEFQKVLGIQHAPTAADCRAAGCTRTPVYQFDLQRRAGPATVLTCDLHGAGPDPDRMALPEATKILWVDETEAYPVCDWHHRKNKHRRYTGSKNRPKQIELQRILKSRLDVSVCAFCQEDIFGGTESDEETPVLADGGVQGPLPAGGGGDDAGTQAEPVRDQADVPENVCANCGEEFPSKNKRTSHQDDSRCFIAKHDLSRAEVREIASEFGTLFELQRELRLNREQTRHLLRGAGCYEDFQSFTPRPGVGNGDADNGGDRQDD